MNYRTIRFSNAKGQAVVEYAIIGSLVAVACIAGCYQIANSFHSLMQSLNDDLSQHSQNSMLAATGPISNISPPPPLAVPDMPPPTSSGAPPPSSPAPTTGANAVIKLADGTSLGITTVTDMQNSIETTGANGTTTLLASSLTQMVDQLVAQGKISTTQAGSLYNLANQGHNIAAVEAAVEGVLPGINGRSAYESADVNFNGKTVGLVELLDSIGYKPDANSTGSELKKLLSLQDQAMGSGALNDPAVASVVNALVQQIYKLGDDLENVGGNVRNGSLAGSNAQSTLASWQSDNASANICKIGGNSDTGTHCQ